MFLISIGMLFGMGAAALASISLGRGDRDLAEKAVGNALVASLAAAAVTIALGYAFMESLLKVFGGAGEVLVEAPAFSRIFLVGSIFQILSQVLGSTVRSEGSPGTALGASLGVNFLLNPLFIFVLKVGVAGSALATTMGGLLFFA
jgi:Na+-driven multidrug efflux pump